ncbi:MAG: hypothetical protein J6S53_07510 [Lentisphaeria bacterium]|nr:hypothetical protein [Lentisphaeria bacterium]
MITRRKTFFVFIFALLFAGAMEMKAQFPGFDFHSGNSTRNRNQPTNVKAESMDIDMNNNRVILIGNVDVDDQDMNIKCRKMILFFSDNKAKEKNTGAKNKKDGSMGGRKIEKIECFGDVEITRSTGSGKDRQLQKAYAGKAVYSLVNNRITLTEKPLVTGGGSMLRGEFITIDTLTGRISVLRPDSRIIGGLKGAGAAK